MRNTLILLFLSQAIGACSFSVKRVPPPNELSKPISDVIKAYPEMEKVFKKEGNHSEFGMARIEPFVKAWGEPKSKVLSWWNLWPGNWLFLPQEIWTWEFENKTIECRVDHPIYEGFTKTICDCQEVPSLLP